MDRVTKQKGFIFLSLLIFCASLIFWFVLRDTWLKPSPCRCADAFSADSAIALPASRKLVGNGHYVFTIQTARKLCDSVYRNADSGLPLDSLRTLPEQLREICR